MNVQYFDELDDLKPLDLELDFERGEPFEVEDPAIRKAADRYYRKNAKEIKRLQEHAEWALLVNNSAAYVYAIDKLRSLSMQPKLDAETMQSLWLTSKERFDEIMREAIRKVEAGQ